MTALLFVTQKLMPHILRCDIKNCIAVLKRLEQEDRKETIAVVDERCDGNRNIFHACVIMCAPTTNKDSPHSPDLASSTEKKPLSSGLHCPVPEREEHRCLMAAHLLEAMEAISTKAQAALPQFRLALIPHQRPHP